MKDPFSDEADPPRLDGSRPPRLPEVEPRPAEANTEMAQNARPALSFGRRPVVLGLAALPVALSLSACAHRSPACPTQPQNPHACQHRFCRYFRG